MYRALDRVTGEVVAVKAIPVTDQVGVCKGVSAERQRNGNGNGQPARAWWCADGDGMVG